MTSILGNTRKADLIFSSSGCINITARIAKHLHLKRGDVIDVLLDQGEFYLYVKCRATMNGQYGAAVYPTNRKGNHFRCSSKKLCNAILHECKIANEARLCIGEPFEHQHYGTLIPIITKHVL